MAFLAGLAVRRTGAFAFSAVLFLAGCLATPEQDRQRYERILWEDRPEIRTHADAVAKYDELSAKKSLTLDECYRLAIHRTETLALKGEELARLQTQYEQAVASYLPRLSFKGSFTEQIGRAHV
jgi:outer membrane protein TolC